MSIEILEEVVMPANVRGGKGSKFFTDDIKNAAEALKVGQGFKLPYPADLPEATKKSRMRTGTKYRFDEHFGDTKTFEFGSTDEGLIIKCIAIKAPVVE